MFDAGCRQFPIAPGVLILSSIRSVATLDLSLAVFAADIRSGLPAVETGSCSASSASLKADRYARCASRGAKSSTYHLVEDLLADFGVNNVVKSVHVQANYDPSDPVGESRWLQEQADRARFPHAIVGHAGMLTADDDATVNAWKEGLEHLHPLPTFCYARYAAGGSRRVRNAIWLAPSL